MAASDRRTGLVLCHEPLAIEPGQSLRGEDVVRVLQRIQQERGGPAKPSRFTLTLVQKSGGPHVM